MNKEKATIYIPGVGDMDVRRVKKVTPNTVSGGGEPTYTLKFDGEHDDTDPNGRPLDDSKVGDYGGTNGNPMPKDARANVGNRATFSESQLVRSGFFDLYKELTGENVGPTAQGSKREQAPAQ